LEKEEHGSVNEEYDEDDGRCPAQVQGPFFTIPAQFSFGIKESQVKD